MEREKQELRDYLEKDKKAMTDKMSAEEAERQRKEKEMAVSSIHSAQTYLCTNPIMFTRIFSHSPMEQI